MEQKPSERIKDIHASLKVLDGQDPNDKHFGTLTFMEQAILQYLDEQENGTAIEIRRNK